MRVERQDQFRKARLTDALEATCEQLELTPTQYELAKSRYEGVGRWLAASSHPALSGLAIYVQGSTAIGTTVKPIGRNEHDVDLIAMLQATARGYSETPVNLCLYLPGTGEWSPDRRLDQTIVPWAALWLFYFEEWLWSNEWKGGGVHPGDEALTRRERRML